jgi:hypothetical protein
MRNPPDPAPRPKRVRLDIEARLICADGEELTVTVIDISKSGFRLRVPESLFVGEQVQLKLGRSGYAAGVIRWIRGDEAGGEFTELS